MRRFSFFFLSLPLLLIAAPASAQNPPPPASPDDPPAAKKQEKEEELRDVYVSFSPFHLLFPIVEITTEVRVHRKIGIAGIAGIGSIDPDGIGAKPPAALDSPRFTAWELGGQFVGYPVGNFDHGMQLGAELLYVGVAGSQSSGGERVGGVGQGLAMGPFIGYKIATKVGFTFNIQGGVEYLAIRADASSSTRTATATQSQFIPLLNINLGWSF